MKIETIDVSWTNDTNRAPKSKRQASWENLQKILTNKWLLIITVIAGAVIYWLSDAIENGLLYHLALLLYLPSIGYLFFQFKKRFKRIPFLGQFLLIIVEAAVIIFLATHSYYGEVTLFDLFAEYLFCFVSFQLLVTALNLARKLLIKIWRLSIKIFRSLKKLFRSPAVRFFIKKRLVFVLLILAVFILGRQNRKLIYRVERLESTIGENRLLCDEKKSVAETKQSVVRIIGRNGQGSGFVVINDDGFGTRSKQIITNYHVVAKNMNPKVVLPDYTLLQGQVIAANKDADIAIISTEEGLENISPLKIARDNNLASLDELIAIGYPLGTTIRGEATANKGHFVALREDEVFSTKMIQTNLALGPGMSGGPLIDVCGNVYGINTLNSQGLSLSVSASDFQSEKWSQMLEAEDRLADIEKIEFKPNENPIECVKAFYNYQTTGELEKAYNLLSKNYTDWSFEDWKKGYQNTLYIVFLKAEQVEDKENTVFVKFYSADLKDEQFTERFFEGEQRVEKYNEQWKLEEANIKEIENPDWLWFYE